nr:lipid phosphate phosphatase 2-like [Ipomoea batatas]
MLIFKQTKAKTSLGPPPLICADQTERKTEAKGDGSSVASENSQSHRNHPRLPPQTPPVAHTLHRQASPPLRARSTEEPNISEDRNRSIRGKKGGAKACHSFLAVFTIATVGLEDQARQSVARLLGLQSRRSGLRTMVSDFGTRWWLLLQRLDFHPKTQQLRRAYSHGSFAGLGFLSWYLSGKIKAFDQQGHAAKLCIVVLPLLFAALVGVSRVDDYWHHWQDVFAGGFIGFTVASFCYLQFFPPPYDVNGCMPHVHNARMGESRNGTQPPIYDQSSSLAVRQTELENVYARSQHGLAITEFNVPDSSPILSDVESGRRY